MNRYKEMLARANQLAKEARDILANDDSQEAIDKAAAKMQEAQELRTKAARANELVGEAESFLSGGESIDDPEPQQLPNQTPKKFKSFDRYLHAVWRSLHPANKKGPDDRLQWFSDSLAPGERKDMAESVGASGGFLVPTEFMPDLMSVAPENSIVRSRATIIRMNRRQVTLPVVDQTGTTAGKPHWFGGMTFYWSEEASEKTETDASFRQFALTAHKLIGYTRASDELVDDSAVSLGDFLTGPLGFSGGIIWMEDYAFLNGTGVGQPQGVIGAGATITVARQNDGSFEYLDFANMLSHMLPQSLMNAVWVINVSAMPRIITLAGPTGSPAFVWNPNAASGIPDTLLGRPVIWTEKNPALNSAGDVGLYDFRYYVVGDRQATTIESTKFDRWQHDQTSWRAVHRVDGRPWLSTEITLQDGSHTVSPFVILGAKSS